MGLKYSVMGLCIFELCSEIFEICLKTYEHVCKMFGYVWDHTFAIGHHLGGCLRPEISFEARACFALLGCAMLTNIANNVVSGTGATLAFQTIGQIANSCLIRVNPGAA